MDLNGLVEYSLLPAGIVCDGNNPFATGWNGLLRVGYANALTGHEDPFYDQRSGTCIRESIVVTHFSAVFRYASEIMLPYG